MKERALRLVAGAAQQGSRARPATRVRDTFANAGGSEGPLRPGDVVDRYRIEHVIASGGMARVYRAVHHFTGHVVALKVMRTRYSDRPDLIDRFQKEAMALSHIRHSNVVAIENGGVTDNGEVFIAMELLEGQTLRELLEQRGRLPVKEALSILSQVAQGVSAAHDVNVIHRDLKPENIFCTSGGAVKVLDLGLAKFIGHDPKETNDAIVGPIGTAAYISPERLDGMPVDVRCDIYSLGLVAYECLAGQHPMVPDGVWPGRQEIALRQLTYSPAPIADLPSELWAAVARAIDKNPERRFSSMDELAAVFHRVRHELGQLERRGVGSRPIWSASVAYEPTEVAESRAPSSRKSASRPAGRLPSSQAIARRPDPILSGPAGVTAFRLPFWLPWRHLLYGALFGLGAGCTLFFYERYAGASRPERQAIAGSLAPSVSAQAPAAPSTAMAPPEGLAVPALSQAPRAASVLSRGPTAASATQARGPAATPAAAGSPRSPEAASRGGRSSASVSKGAASSVVVPRVRTSAASASPAPKPRTEVELPGSGLSAPSLPGSNLPSSGLTGSPLPTRAGSSAARPGIPAPGARR